MSRYEMTWDLSQLVESTSPNLIQETLQYMVNEAERIQDVYRGKIENLGAKELLELLQLKDSLYLKYEGTVKYCKLKYSADSTDDAARQLNNAERRASMKVGQALAFFDIELGRLLNEKPSLIEDPILSEYKHFLEKTLRRASYMRSEAEEQAIIMKDKNGVNAWQMLQSDWLSTRTFDIEIDGERKTLPYGKIIGLYQSPNRELRKQANQVVYENLAKDEIIWASAIRAVCEDHVQMCKLRGYPSSMTQSLIANDLDRETVDSLMNTIKKNANLYQRYLQLKAKLMGLEKLANYDLRAPLPSGPNISYTWKQAREEVASAYNGFDKEIAGWVTEMFERQHIDGEVRKGKESGAFCTSWLAGKTAYIIQSFNEKIGDVYTLMHELGHAAHAYLGARAQKPSNLQVGSCMAETASIFAELLLTEHLISKATTKEKKQAILATILDEFGIAAFQVSARFFFEHAMYNAIMKGKLLDGETVSSLWTTARDEIFGDAVDWLDVMKWEWTMKLHYYIANYRFYNYPYVYGQLFVFALYRLYKEQGRNFVPKLKGLLSAGSTKSPRELAAELGFDITKKSFWQKGMKQAEEFVDMLERTL